MMAREKKKNDGRGGFFAVDRRCWHLACDLGVNCAVAYLCLCSGTGGNHSTTFWSANSVEKHSGISRPLAKLAIQRLLEKKLIWRDPAFKRPAYKIGRYSEEGPTPWVWLPNALIIGAPGNAHPPVELVRQSQNLLALRVLVDLYFVHDLPAFGGVHWRIIRQKFDRKLIGECNENRIWHFTQGRRFAETSGNFFAPLRKWKDDKTPEQVLPAVEFLEGLGLLSFVPHLVEGDGDDAAMVHPFGWGNGEAAEQRLAVACHRAGAAMAQIAPPAKGALVPAKKHLREVTMVGVIRLLYKPHTGATAAWLARMAEWDALAELREEEANSAAEYRRKTA